MICHIKVDVTCHWSDHAPIYRIYVDDDLIVERTFGWAGYNNYIRENIICELNSGIHNLKLENCSQTGSFVLENFTMEENPNPIHPNIGVDIPSQKTFIVP